MTQQNEYPDAEQQEYTAALELMQEGLHRAAQNKLQALIDRYHAAPDTIRLGLAADAMRTLAVSQRDNGEIDDALETFRQTSILFAHNTTEQTSTPPPIPSEADDAGYFYQKIESKFEATPHSWQLAPGGLVVTRYGQAVEFPYPLITQLVLCFAPTKLKTNRYTVRVTHQNGASAEIDNMHFRGFGDFEDLSFKYAILVHGLSQKLAAAGAPCEVHGGVSWLRYLLTLGLSAVILLVMLIVVVMGGPILILIKIVLIALYFPTMYRWLKLNRPRQGTLKHLPDGTVPPLIP
jgi:hypothetical protein